MPIAIPSAFTDRPKFERVTRTYEPMTDLRRWRDAQQVSAPRLAAAAILVRFREEHGMDAKLFDDLLYYTLRHRGNRIDQTRISGCENGHFELKPPALRELEILKRECDRVLNERQAQD